MANITIRIDDDTKKQLQELMTELGLDITAYFTMAAKQAIRERRIPFEITANIINMEETNMFDKEKLNALAKDFDNIENRKEIIRLFSDIETALTGNNENGETVEIHIGKGEEPLITKTYQENGWVRVNYYDTNGQPTTETFEGRWNTEE